MKKILINLAAAVAVVVPAAPASAQQQSQARSEREVSIPFVSFRNVRDFRSIDRYTVYLQDRRRNWYRASLAQPCFDLPFVHAIGIDTRGSNSVDRFSSLIVGRDRCQIQSLVRSGPPPKKVKGKRQQS